MAFDKIVLFLMSSLFINDILDGYSNYVVTTGSSSYCGGLFTNDIVLIAPTKNSLKYLLHNVHKWAKINEMNFVNECTTKVMKPPKLVK